MDEAVSTSGGAAGKEKEVSTAVQLKEDLQQEEHAPDKSTGQQMLPEVQDASQQVQQLHKDKQRRKGTAMQGVGKKQKRAKASAT